MSEPSGPLPQLEAALSAYERQYLALLDTQARHRSELLLSESGILPRAANLADLPVTDNLHVCVFQGIRYVQNVREEYGGIRFKDLNEPDAKRSYVPVYSREDNGPIEPFMHFNEEHCLIVAGMIAELVFRDKVDFDLRPDLTEMRIPIDFGH